MKLSLFSLLSVITLGSTAHAQLKVGNNPGVVNSSAALEVESSNKGFLPPRIALTGISDATTIPAPAQGLVVFNTAAAGSGNSILPEGLVVNTGTPAAPIWSAIDYSSATVGSVVTKLPVTVAAFANILTNGDYSFSYGGTGTQGYWRIRYNGTGAARKIGAHYFDAWPTGYGDHFYNSGNGSLILSPGVWVAVSTNVGDSLELNVYRFYDYSTGQVYRFEGQLLNLSGQIMESMIVERF